MTQNELDIIFGVLDTHSHLRNDEGHKLADVSKVKDHLNILFRKPVFPGLMPMVNLINDLMSQKRVTASAIALMTDTSVEDTKSFLEGNKLPSFQQIQVIAQCLGVTPADLLCEIKEDIEVS